MAWAAPTSSGRFRGGYRDREGKTLYLPDTYNTAAEARREAAAKEDEVRRRPSWRKTSGQMAWGAWADEWLPQRNVEPGTARGDRTRLETHIRPRWGTVALESISREDVQDWVNGLRSTRKTKAAKRGTGVERGGKQHRVVTDNALSASTVTKVYRLFSASMRAAYVAGRIEATPCVGITLPTPEPGDEYYLTRDEEFPRLLECAPDDLTRLVLELGTGTGLRWGELVGLHRARVDVKHRRLLVQEVYDQAEQEIKPYPKGRSRRGVPLTDALARRLDEWMSQHPAKPCATRHRGGKPCRGALLIPSKAGSVLNYSNFRRDRWNPMVKEAGLEGATPHDMRHTYASWLIQDGVRIEVLSALLGHKDIQTTQRYAHLGDEHWGEVRDVLDSTPVVDTDPLENLARLAAEDPEKWGPVLEAARAAAVGTGAAAGDSASDLLHAEPDPETAKIIFLDRFRRSDAV